MQLKVSFHVALNEHRRDRGIETRREKVKNDLANIDLQVRSVGIVRRQRMIVRDKEVALILVLQLHPVMQRTHIVSQVQLARRTHPAQNTRT
jgi:hypothetical protein